MAGPSAGVNELPSSPYPPYAGAEREMTERSKSIVAYLADQFGGEWAAAAGRPSSP